uniref:Putative spindle assembly checkpoint protein n=1 Tax=Triatoma infestans TaxID=30076 RepID=A0A023F8M9_TRIIF
MSAVAQLTRNAITLKGSAKMVTDYLNFGINSILFQRGIYPPETFRNEEHFGLSIYVSSDEKINTFLQSVLGQIKDWLLIGKVKQLSLVITNLSNKEVLERWDFKLQYEEPVGKCNDADKPIGTKDIKIIQNEIRDVLRQICSSVSFLPLLDCPCAFDILTHTTLDADVPSGWDEAGPCFIVNSEELRFRSFSTSLHRMDTVVSYKKIE